MSSSTLQPLGQHNVVREDMNQILGGQYNTSVYLHTYFHVSPPPLNYACVIPFCFPSSSVMGYLIALIFFTGNNFPCERI